MEHHSIDMDADAANIPSAAVAKHMEKWLQSVRYVSGRTRQLNVVMF